MQRQAVTIRAVSARDSPAVGLYRIARPASRVEYVPIHGQNRGRTLRASKTERVKLQVVTSARAVALAPPTLPRCQTRVTTLHGVKAARLHTDNRLP